MRTVLLHDMFSRDISSHPARRSAKGVRWHWLSSGTRVPLIVFSLAWTFVKLQLLLFGCCVFVFS